jgi:hypothetical protein
MGQCGRAIAPLTDSIANLAQIAQPLVRSTYSYGDKSSQYLPSALKN